MYKEQKQQTTTNQMAYDAFVEMLKKQQNKVCSCCGDIENAEQKECGCDQEGFNRGIEKAIEMFIKYYC